MSEVLPIFLCNTPFRTTQIFVVNRVCTYGAIGVMGIMAVTLIGSFFIKWPHMPLNPSTVAGAMYYICDSWMLGGFENGVSTLSRKERDWRLANLNLRYTFGRTVGTSGTSRIGIDMSEDSRIPI